MSTLTAKSKSQVAAKNARVSASALTVELRDGREVTVPLATTPWLRWLANAAPRHRANWSLEPGGFAIYWPDLDDGVEICHLLDTQAIA